VQLKLYIKEEVGLKVCVKVNAVFTHSVMCLHTAFGSETSSEFSLTQHYRVRLRTKTNLVLYKVENESLKIIYINIIS